MAFSHSDLGYALSGLLVGVLVGQTGVGGGSMMTPLLVLVFGMHPATAVGSDLLYASATKTVGSMVHGANRNVDWRLTGRLACGSLPATAITLYVVSRSNFFGDKSAHLLSILLGCVLVTTALSLIFRQQVVDIVAGLIGENSPRRTAWLTVLTGVALGVLVSVTSIGAGALGVCAMLALYPRMPVRTIIGSDIAHAVPLTLLAGFGHFIMGSVDLHLVLVLLIGSIPGVLVGSVLLNIIPERISRAVLAAVLTIVGVRLVI